MSLQYNLNKSSKRLSSQEKNTRAKILELKIYRLLNPQYILQIFTIFTKFLEVNLFRLLAGHASWGF